MPGVPRRAEFRRRVTGAGLYITLGYVNREAASFGRRVRGGSDNPGLSDRGLRTPRDGGRSEEGPDGARRAPRRPGRPRAGETRPLKPLRAALAGTREAAVMSARLECVTARATLHAP